MNIAESNLKELYGVICWNCKWDYNLNLSINFGQPSLSIVEPRGVKTDNEKIRKFRQYRHVTLRGEWFLWILGAYWKLSIKDFGEVTSASQYKKMAMALARLDGQKIIDASVNPLTSATQLIFDLGAQISIRRTRISSREDIWSLYKPNEYVFSVRADGKYKDVPGKHADNEKDWAPISQPYK